jgi:hypothetical protein
VPGYRAPQDTVGPAARVPLAFAGVLRDALAAEEASAGDDAEAGTEPGLPGPLAGQAAALAATLTANETSGTNETNDTDGTSNADGTEGDTTGGPAVPPGMLVRAVIAWTQLFGMLSFELFGQFVGSFEPADSLFAHAAADLATYVGLRGS